MTKRVLICGNPDLNYIDGSSIWAQTIALVFAATGCAKVDFLTRSAPERDELYAPLKANDDIALIDGSDRAHWQGKGFKRITPAMMGELAIRLDCARHYDVIIVRGLEIAKQLLDAPDVLAKCWMYLTDIPQALSDCAPEDQLVIQRIAKGCHRLLCQSEGFKSLWCALAPNLSQDKIYLYSPVIPDFSDHYFPISERPLQAIYAGKFKADWMTLEMAEAWPAIHQELPSSKMVMVGDKIHVEQSQPDFAERMRQALQHTNGLSWLGAQPREVVQELLRQARVGLSWRHEGMNNTLEYSTKILEYGGAGCAAILNRNSLHEQLLGHDYPLFANSHTEFSHQLTRALREPQLAQHAADVLKSLAMRHTFSSRVDQMRQWLKEAPRLKAKIRVLVAGHDLKFFMHLQKKLEATGQFHFLIDQWRGHTEHDEAKSRVLLEQADVIFCEWCLGNIKWYSQNKKPNQRLVARFHAQELRAKYLTRSKWFNIDHVSFVSEHIRHKALELLGNFPIDKTSVIPNYLDETKFIPLKKTGEARFTLGILGIVPMSKRLDRALDLLEALLEEDDRYCLRVKSKHPLAYPWILEREDEMAFYHNVFERINSNPKLRYKVIFDPHGDDVNDWFRMIGFILSPSDNESFHMALGEGMLTGSAPIIWTREGAEDIWPGEVVVPSSAAASQFVLQANLDFDTIRARVLRLYCPSDVINSWSHLLSYR